MDAGEQMTKQQLHSQLAPVDLLTREELSAELHKGLESQIMDRFRGLEIQRFPRTFVTATQATQQIYAGNDMTPCGPEQGDIWHVRRVIVKSNQLNDSGKWILYRGSTPSDLVNSYGTQFVLEAFAASGGGLPVNQGYYFTSKTVFLQPGEQLYALILSATVGNQYYLDGEAIRVPAEMKGKIL